MPTEKLWGATARRPVTDDTAAIVVSDCSAKELISPCCGGTGAGAAEEDEDGEDGTKAYAAAIA